MTKPITPHPPYKEFRAIRDEVKAMLAAKHQASFAADRVAILDKEAVRGRKLLIHQEQLIYPRQTFNISASSGIVAKTTRQQSRKGSRNQSIIKRYNEKMFLITLSSCYELSLATVPLLQRPCLSLMISSAELMFFDLTYSLHRPAAPQANFLSWICSSRLVM